MHGFMGKTIEIIAEMMFPDMQVSERENILKECCSEEQAYLSKHGGHPYDGIIEMLENLKCEKCSSQKALRGFGSLTNVSISIIINIVLKR